MVDMIDDDADFDAQLKEMLGHTPDDASTDTITAAPEELDTAALEDQALTAPAPPADDADTVEGDAMAKKAKAAERKMHEATQAAAELRKQNALLEQRFNELQASLAAKPEQPRPDQDGTGIEQALEDYPEIVAPLVKHNKLLEDKLAKLEAKFGEVSQTTDSMVRTANEKALESKISAIETAHPDAQDIIGSEEFSRWRGDLPPIMAQAIHNAIDYAEPKDVIMALNMYKQSQGTPLTGFSKEDKLAAAKAAATPSVASRNKPQAQTKTLTREQLAKVSAKDFMADPGLEDLLLASLESGSLR